MAKGKDFIGLVLTVPQAKSLWFLLEGHLANARDSDATNKRLRDIKVKLAKSLARSSTTNPR